MILPQVASNTIFPNDNVPESEKLKPQFGRNAGRALYSRFCNGGAYFTYNAWSAMQEIRNYGAGMQSSQKYVNFMTNGSSIGNTSLRNNKVSNTGAGGSSQNAEGNFGTKAGKGNRKGFANISYDIFSPMAKYSNVLLSILSENDYKVDFVSLDKNVVKKKKERKADVLVTAKVVNPLLESIGMQKMNVPFVPKDEAEVDMAEKLGFFKTRQEVALEKLAEAAFRASRWHDLRITYNRDAIDFGFRCVKMDRDPITGQIILNYVDPCNLVMLWNEDNNNEPVAIGHVHPVFVCDVFDELIEAGFTEDQIQMMAKQQVAFQEPGTVVSPWIWERKDQTTNKWLWMDFKIFVLTFEYLSTDYKQYVEREVKGKSYYQSVKDIDKLKAKDNTIGEPDTFKRNYWYEGNYIISSSGMDMVYGWRKKPNQMQKGLSPRSSYIIDRILGEAPTSRVIGLLDDLMFAVCKLRAAVWAAAPKGYVIDVSAAANIKIGNQEYDIFDMIHIQRQNGIRLVSTKFNAATGKFQTEVYKTEDNGLGPQGLEWMQQIANILNMIKDTLGIPDIMAASPSQSGERLAGVMEMDIQAGNNANWILAASERRFKEKVAERVAHQARIDIEYDPKIKEHYEGLIGEDLMAELGDIKDFTLNQLGISTRALPTEKEKDAILATAVEMSKIATRDGSILLKPSSVERIRQLLKNDDIDEALWFMDAEEKRARQQEQEHEKQMAQMTFQGQQQSAMVSEQAKQQTIQIQSQLRLQEIEAEKNKEIAVLQAKYQFETPSKLAQISAKGDEDLRQMVVEIEGEKQTNTDIKNPQ